MNAITARAAMPPSSACCASTDTLTAFTFDPVGITVRAIVRDGQVWFVAKDVCDVLGYANASKAVADHLDADERMTLTNRESHSGKRGGRQSLTIISESGLYALVLRSNKPQARAFRKWVTGTVLPSINRHGGYIKGAEQLPEQAQAALYDIARATCGEFLERYDRATEHTHYRIGRSSDAGRRQAIAADLAQAHGLPVNVALAVAERGVDAGLKKALGVKR